MATENTQTIMTVLTYNQAQEVTHGMQREDSEQINN